MMEVIRIIKILAIIIIIIIIIIIMIIIIKLQSSYPSGRIMMAEPSACC